MGPLGHPPEGQTFQRARIPLCTHHTDSMCSLSLDKHPLVHLLCLETQNSSSLTVRKKKVYSDFCVGIFFLS